MEQPILSGALAAKICSPEEAAAFIKNGMTVAVSGFTLSSYPKAVPLALAKRVRESGESIKVNLYSGASIGPEIDGAWTENHIIERRLPYQTDAVVRKSINAGEIRYVDLHLSLFSQQLIYGFIKKPDVAIVEAAGITEKGDIIPAAAVGIMPQAIKLADKVIVEINTSNNPDFYGMHDIYMPKKPPHRGVIPIRKVGDRIGTPYIPCGKKKIVAIVPTALTDAHRELTAVDETFHKMAGYLLEFLDFEVKKGRLPQKLLPIQSGVGAVANAVLAGMGRSKYEKMEFYTEVIQESVLDLIDQGKVNMVSGTAVSPSPEGFKRFQRDIARYKKHIVLRPQEISNHCEVIRRLGVISVNTPIEGDIYGNVNSTHIMGSAMMNGLGGSGDFARNAYLSIFATPATAKQGRISAIVPMVSHVDHISHDVSVFLTEQGFADLRGLSPQEKAREIITKCAHPDYKEMLWDYFKRAKKTSPQHTPHLLQEALAWHQRYLETGSMK